jgi:antitoxin component of RelBE/YafQ-DinJ toxin-antitoxin module
METCTVAARIPKNWKEKVEDTVRAYGTTEGAIIKNLYERIALDGQLPEIVQTKDIKPSTAAAEFLSILSSIEGSETDLTPEQMREALYE